MARSGTPRIGSTNDVAEACRRFGQSSIADAAVNKEEKAGPAILESVTVGEITVDRLAVSPAQKRLKDARAAYLDAERAKCAAEERKERL